MNNQDDFNLSFDRFTASFDPKEHKGSIRNLLSEIKLEDEFDVRLNEGSELIKNFFQSFKNASADTSIPEIERISMIEIGSRATRYIKNNQYHKLAGLAFNLVFRNLTDFLQLSKRKDFDKLTFQNLYHKRLLPPEVFFQFFLLETLANEKIYNWNRNKIIVDQSLACLEVCFSDIYRFLHHADSADAAKELPSIPQITEESFKNAIKRTIADNRHTDYMQNLLRQYEEYKQFFSQVWTIDNPAEAIYEFRATYLKKDATFRDIAILGSQSFDDLAEEIIAAMGWENDHMHGFSFPQAEDNTKLFSYSPYTFFAPQWQKDQHPIFTSDQILICHIDYDRFPVLHFEFDFGDSHLFEVSLKKIRQAKRDETYKTLPRVIAQQGKAPKQYLNYS